MQVSASSLRRTFPDLLEIMADVTRHASFPSDEVERQRASRLASLVQQRENANAVAATVMAAALYGEAHPYGYPELGSEASNKAMTREDMQRFWSQNFVPNNAALIVSGQITSAELRPMVEKAFGQWEKGAPSQPSLGNPATTTAQAGDRRQAGRAADAAAGRRHRCAARDAGLRSAAGDERERSAGCSRAASI